MPTTSASAPVLRVHVAIASLVAVVVFGAGAEAGDRDVGGSIEAHDFGARGTIGRSTRPVISCAEIGQRDFSRLPDAPARILSAEQVPASDTVPAHCLVTGYVAPQIRFELRLPTSGWTRRYLQIGCGGFCGSAGIPEKLEREGHLGGCRPDFVGGMAVGSSNSGHVGQGGADALWARNAPQLKIDWGYRSEHALAIAAKAIIAAPMHAGVRVPIGIAEPRIIPAAIVEGAIGLAFAAAASAVFAGRSRAWAVATGAHAIAIGGILLGMVALSLEQGPRTEANDVYHRVTLAVSVTALVFLLTPLAKGALGRGRG